MLEGAGLGYICSCSCGAYASGGCADDDASLDVATGGNGYTCAFALANAITSSLVTDAASLVPIISAPNSFRMVVMLVGGRENGNEK